MSKMCGSAAEQGENCLWVYCCKGSKLCLGLLLKGSKMIWCAAVQEANYLWNCCFKGSNV